MCIQQLYSAICILVTVPNRIEYILFYVVFFVVVVVSIRLRVLLNIQMQNM